MSTATLDPSPFHRIRRRAIGFVTLLAVALAGAVTAQELRVTGARLTPDADFYAHGHGVHTTFLGDHLDGGRLLVLFSNDGEVPITPVGVSLAGRDFDEFTDAAILNGDIPSVNWWSVEPATVAPGEMGSLRVRLLDLNDIGEREGELELSLRTDQGSATLTLSPESSPLWIPYAAFLTDSDGMMTEAVVYLGNSGSQPLTLADDGGVSIGGVAAVGTIPEPRLEPGLTVPVRVTLPRPLRPGSWVTLEVRPHDQPPAIASLRAFPADFGVSFWQVGTSPNLTDPSFQTHSISLDTPGATVLQDEPFTGRVAPDEVLRRIRTTQLNAPQNPVMLQLTSYEENLIYSDMSDITLTHVGEVEQDLSLFMSWPKPIWYMPFNAWAQIEGLGLEEAWRPLEDLTRQALGGIARGAKHIQWFTYWNLWEQGFGRGGASETTRTHPDIFLFGAVGNPVLLDRVGRISRTLEAAREFLSVSAPYHRERTGVGVEVATLLSGMDRAVVVLIDRRTPPPFYTQQDPDWQPLRLGDLQIEAALPRFVVAERAFLIDPLTGIHELPLERLDEERVALQVPELNAAALIVVGDETDGQRLRQAWRTPSRETSENVAVSAIASSRSVPELPWIYPESRYRFPVTITNPGPSARLLLSFDLPWPNGVPIDPDSIRVVEMSDGVATPVSFSAEPSSVYAVFGDERGDTMALSDNPRFGDLYSGGLTGEGFENTYQSHPSERYAYGLGVVNDGSWGRDGWIATSYTRLSLETRDLEATRNAKAQRLILDFDLDLDGVRDESVALFLVRQPSEVLVDGWTRFDIDVEAALRTRRPDLTTIQGAWRPWFQTEVFPSPDPRPSTWTLRRMTAERNTRIALQPSAALGPGATASYAVYFDRLDNGPVSRSSHKLPRLPSSSPQPSLAGDLEIAGAEVSLAGDLLSISTQANERAVLVKHIDDQGRLLQQVILRPENGSYPPLQLARRPGPDDLIVATVIQPGGVGHPFSFTAGGDLLRYDQLPSTETLPSRWTPPP